MTSLNLPADFKPCATLRIGENRFHNVNAVLALGGQAPLLLGGQGDPLRVWLSAPPAAPGLPWTTVVANNVPNRPDITVESNPRLIKIAMPGITLLSAVHNGHDGVSVLVLDLRPIGIPIFLDGKVLHIMTNTLQVSDFSNLDALLTANLPA